MPFLNTSDGTSLFYTDDGPSTGRPVLLVHGWTCDSHDWSWQIPYLQEQGFRVVAPDLRGHGRSSAPGSGYTVADFAKDLGTLLVALRLSPVVAIGHSLGGAVVSQLAVDRPDLVLALVAVDSSYGPAEGIDPDALFAALRSSACHDTVAAICDGLSTEQTPPHLLTWYKRRGAGMSSDVIAATAEGLLNSRGGIGPTEELLSMRSMPVLAVHRDPRAAAWESATLRADGVSRTVLWEGPGHWVHQERADDFNRLVVSWIGDLMTAEQKS